MTDILHMYARSYTSVKENNYSGRHPSDDFYAIQSVPEELYIHPRVLLSLGRVYNLVLFTSSHPYIYDHKIVRDNDSPCPATMKQIIDYSWTKVSR